MHLDPDRRLAAQSRGSHGVFHEDDVVAIGYPLGRLQYLRDQRLVVRLHPKVFAFAATPLTWLGHLMAAVKWASPALAAVRSAAALHRLPGFDDAPLEVLTENRKIVPRAGIRVHVTTRLPRDHSVRVQGIPCTSVERTVMDLFGFIGERRASIALDHTLHRGLATLGGYDFCLYLTAAKGRNGCGKLRAHLKERLGMTSFPNSPLETVIFELICGHDLPRPEPQLEIFGRAGDLVARPDFVYEKERIVIEGHSRLWHENEATAARDLEKHRRLTGMGYRVLYVTWPDATTRAEATALAIKRLLDAPPSNGNGNAPGPDLPSPIDVQW